MRSGIGDSEEIKKHGIEIVHELKGVGKNLQDHIAVVSQFQCTQPVTLHRSANFLGTMLAGVKYLVTGTGDAANPPCVGGAFIKSNPEKRNTRYSNTLCINRNARCSWESWCSSRTRIFEPCVFM